MAFFQEKGKGNLRLAALVCVVVLVCFCLGAFAGGLASQDQSTAKGSSAATQSGASTQSNAAQSTAATEPSAAAQSSSSTEAKAPEKEVASSSASSTSSKSEKSSSSSQAKPAKDKLYALVGEEVADKLVKRAKKNEDAAWIAAHPEVYVEFREHIQEKLLTLAADEAEAAAFVRGVPKKFPAKKPNYDAEALPVDLQTDKVPQTYYPHLYQWDERWGYTMYDGDPFGLSGCGPTAMAMVYQGITGNEEETPYDMGQLAFKGGFVDPDYGGTYDGYYPYAAEQLGLRYEEIPVGADSITSALKDGKAIIAHVGPGTFSHVGHFIVLADIVDSNKVVVNDPYSPARSSKLWKADLIASEAVALYAYSAPAA